MLQAPIERHIDKLVPVIEKMRHVLGPYITRDIWAGTEPLDLAWTLLTGCPYARSFVRSLVTCHPEICEASNEADKWKGRLLRATFLTEPGKLLPVVMADLDALREIPGIKPSPYGEGCIILLGDMCAPEQVGYNGEIYHHFRWLKYIDGELNNDIINRDAFAFAVHYRGDMKMMSGDRTGFRAVARLRIPMGIQMIYGQYGQPTPSQYRAGASSAVMSYSPKIFLYQF